MDDGYALPIAAWLRKVMVLPAYGGAFAFAMAQQGASKPQPAAATQSSEPGELTDAQVKARFMQVLALTYPEHMADGGIKEVSPEQLEKEMSS